MTELDTVLPKFFSCFSYSLRPAVICASALSSWERAAGQLGIDQFQQLCVDPVDPILIELHLHQLFHQTAGRNAGHTALALHFRHKGVLDKLRKLVLVGTFAADSHRHESFMFRLYSMMEGVRQVLGRSLLA